MQMRIFIWFILLVFCYVIQVNYACTMHINKKTHDFVQNPMNEIVKNDDFDDKMIIIIRTEVPCCFIACWAIVFNLSRYNWAARDRYFCWASVVVQLCCRKNCDAFALPPNCICLNCIHAQFVSRFVERTNVKWTPRLRWTAEQSIQINTPYVTDDHVGFFALQSKHVYVKGK